MDTWTTTDDALLAAHSRAQRVVGLMSGGGELEEAVDASGTSATVHRPGSWGACSHVTSGIDDPEVQVRVSLGGRVRDKDVIDPVLAEHNAWFAGEGGPLNHHDDVSTPIDALFVLVREGDRVHFEARYRPDELTDSELWWVDWRFDNIVVNGLEEIDEHLEEIHREGDEDCVCDLCFEQWCARNPE